MIYFSNFHDLHYIYYNIYYNILYIIYIIYIIISKKGIIIFNINQMKQFFIYLKN